jgi:hypothetical protein
MPELDTLPILPPPYFKEHKKVDKEKLAKEEPLEIWKLYTRAKDALPQGARLENLTWRMMGMSLGNRNRANSPDKESPEAKVVPQLVETPLTNDSSPLNGERSKKRELDDTASEGPNKIPAVHSHTQADSQVSEL